MVPRNKKLNDIPIDVLLPGANFILHHRKKEPIYKKQYNMVMHALYSSMMVKAYGVMSALKLSMQYRPTTPHSAL
ncbi:hypothetical protein TNCV_957471 [Trichonephila clavipes]|nr:hypothetical protein TNCV_957471 [Trichonephila clavipes]